MMRVDCVYEGLKATSEVEERIEAGKDEMEWYLYDEKDFDSPE